MHYIEPQVFLVGQTNVNREGLQAYLTYIGVPEWRTDAPSSVEEIVEVMSRGCYKSFGTGLNPNLTKVRTSNKGHLDNVLSSRHGSVLEHGFVNFMFTDVSRVFTHELVRHRAGTAISQESLRYVRLTDLGQWIPSAYRNNAKAVRIFERAWEQAEENYKELLSVEVLDEDIDQDKFGRKKELTSAARRISPIGLATNIGWSCNIRTLRHVIEQRTDPSAEEEMRLVFHKVGLLAKKEWPNLFSDYEMEGSSFVTPNIKV